MRRTVSNLSSDLASLRIERDADPNRPRGWRRLLLLGVALGLVATGWAVGYPLLKARIFKTEVALAEVTLSSPVQTSVTVTSTGYVVPQKTSKVGTKITGRLIRVRIKEGDTVKAGDIIALLDSADQRSTIAAAGERARAATARVATAQATLAEVERQVARDRALAEKGAIAEATLEDLELRRRSLEEQVRASAAEARAAEAELGPMRVGLGERTILAPIDGTVVAKPLEVGELVGPGSTVTEIADFRSLLVETDVPEARLYQIKIATPCEIVLDAYPGKRYRGEVVEIGKRVDRAKATLMVKVKFVDSMNGVLPNMSARASFLSKPLSEDALQEKPKRIIPVSAVVRRGDDLTGVFSVEEDVVRFTRVKLGSPFQGGVEITDGPKPGTRIVVDPPEGLTDGQHIKEKGTEKG